jgi:circadian clock protein KaiB
MKYELKLFVTGRTVRSERAVHTLRQLCQSRLGENFHIHVIDVLESPHLAEAEHILATPTLIKLKPLPMRRILGDLSQLDRVVAGLDLPEGQAPFHAPT